MKNKHGPTASNTPHTTLPNAPHTLCLSMMHCDALPAADEPETTCRASHATARAVLWCGDWSLATDSAPKFLGCYVTSSHRVAQAAAARRSLRSLVTISGALATLPESKKDFRPTMRCLINAVDIGQQALEPRSYRRVAQARGACASRRRGSSRISRQTSSASDTLP